MIETELIDCLNNHHYKENYQPKKEDTIFKIADSTIGTKGNFIVYSGLPKAGKTTFLAAAIASAYSKNKSIFQQSLSSEMIGYFDTESSENDFYNNLTRIKHIGNIKKFNPNFNAFFVREYGAEMIRNLIEYYIIKQAPAVVVIDGLLDIINNYNNETESKQVIDWLKKITSIYNCLIIGVIHLGKRDGHTLGHFGSMVDRYAQSVLTVTRDELNKNIYSLSAKYLRSAPIWFNDISIEFTGLTYEEIIIETYQQPQQKKRRNQ